MTQGGVRVRSVGRSVRRSVGGSVRRGTAQGRAAGEAGQPGQPAFVRHVWVDAGARPDIGAGAAAGWAGHLRSDPLWRGRAEAAEKRPAAAGFLVQAHSTGATFIVHQSGAADLEQCAWPFASKPEPVVYTDGEDALGAVRRVVG